jgi:hypothetical protein
VSTVIAARASATTSPSITAPSCSSTAGGGGRKTFGNQLERSDRPADLGCLAESRSLKPNLGFAGLPLTLGWQGYAKGGSFDACVVKATEWTNYLRAERPGGIGLERPASRRE